MSINKKSDNLLTPKDICELLSITIRDLYDKTSKNKIPHLKIHGHLRFRPSQIEEWLKSKEVR